MRSLLPSLLLLPFVIIKWVFGGGYPRCKEDKEIAGIRNDYMKSLSSGVRSDFIVKTGGTNPSESLPKRLKRLYCKGDFTVLIMGDPQLFWQCERSKGCQRACNDKDANGVTQKCKREQGIWSNLFHYRSMTSLIKQMINVALPPPNALIINGDLTAFGHDEELKAYCTFWHQKLDGKVDIYPGLGNHDYENNVDDCFAVFNNCANRMLKYMYYQYRHGGLDRFHRTDISFDLQTSFNQGKNFIHTLKRDRIFTGSLSVSWDMCDPGKINCVHFVQLNNYPEYTKTITYKRSTADGKKMWDWVVGIHKYKKQWQITTAYEWLAVDLARTAFPVVLNVHITVNYEKAKKILEQSDEWYAVSCSTVELTQEHSRITLVSGRKFLAVFMGHVHVGGGHYGTLELNDAMKQRIPRFLSGSPPGGEYLLVHFGNNTIKEVYVMDVVDGKTEVKIDQH